MVDIDIRLRKANKTYKEGELVTGVIVINSNGEQSHSGITLYMDGIVNLQLSAKSVGVFEAFYNSVKPIQLISYSLEVAKGGRLPTGKTEIPFELPLKGKGGKNLYETYHGVFVNVTYTIKVEMKRKLLSKDVVKQCEIIVEYKDQAEKASTEPLPFTISPDNLQNVKDKTIVPKFKIKGKIDTTHCLINQPFHGEVIVDYCEAAIKSIELQLVRVETCGCAEGYSKDATEIQNIQVGEGNICRGLPVPIFMTFPRLFTCPTLATTNFKIEFEVNLVIIFHDDHIVTETFPIKLFRY